MSNLLAAIVAGALSSFLFHPKVDATIESTSAGTASVDYEEPFESFFIGPKLQGTCSCGYDDNKTSGAHKCQVLRERGGCPDLCTGVGTDKVECQRNARSSAKADCHGCLKQYGFRPGRK